MVYSIPVVDSTEEIIQKMIYASQIIIDVQSQVPGEAREGWGINPAVKRYLELEIKTLQNASRDEGKQRELLKLKEKQNEEATHMLKILKKVSYREIEMLKVVLHLISRDN